MSLDIRFAMHAVSCSPFFFSLSKSWEPILAGDAKVSGPLRSLRKLDGNHRRAQDWDACSGFVA